MLRRAARGADKAGEGAGKALLCWGVDLGNPRWPGVAQIREGSS